MTRRDEHNRQARWAHKDRRWPALRTQAFRRDGYACVKCGARGRLEADHIRPVRDHPAGAFDLANLQTLCGPCHSRKTRIDVGLGRPDPKREADAAAWASLVRELHRPPTQNKW